MFCLTVRFLKGYKKTLNIQSNLPRNHSNFKSRNRGKNPANRPLLHSDTAIWRHNGVMFEVYRSVPKFRTDRSRQTV